MTPSPLARFELSLRYLQKDPQAVTAAHQPTRILCDLSLPLETRLRRISLPPLNQRLKQHSASTSS